MTVTHPVGFPELPPDRQRTDGSTTLEQLTRAQQGDRVALGMLLSRYERRIERWLVRAGIQNPSDREELRQDVTAKAIAALDAGGQHWPDANHFRSWVKTITTNTALDFRARGGARRIQRHLESVYPETPVADHVAGRENTPSEDAIARERAAAQARVDTERQRRIARLAESERQLIALREERGLEFAIIARILSESTGREQKSDAVRVRYNRLLDDIGPAPV